MERWLAVVGYEGLYEVSDLGRVRSLDRLVPHGRGGAMRRRKGQLLKPGRKPSGHLSVVLGHRGSHDVHILVLTAFVGPKLKGMEARHWDDDAGNNRLGNLLWGTRSENLHDAVRNGKKAIGVAFSGSKLNPDLVRAIRTREKRPAQWARELGVSESTVRQARDGRAWKAVV